MVLLKYIIGVFIKKPNTNEKFVIVSPVDNYEVRQIKKVNIFLF